MQSTCLPPKYPLGALCSSTQGGHSKNTLQAQKKKEKTKRSNVLFGVISELTSSILHYERQMKIHLIVVTGYVQNYDFMKP